MAFFRYVVVYNSLEKHRGIPEGLLAWGLRTTERQKSTPVKLKC